MTRIFRTTILTGILTLALGALAWAGGGNAVESPCGCKRINTRELRRHVSEMHDVVCDSTHQAQQAMDREAGKWARQTRMVGAEQDIYGDPMYAAYGPRAYADTPYYNGPSYTASFQRGYAGPVADARNRTYYRDVYGVPQVRTHSDVGLVSGSSQSYLQSGMIYSPASMAPAGWRPSALNY